MRAAISARVRTRLMAYISPAKAGHSGRPLAHADAPTEKRTGKARVKAWTQSSTAERKL